MTKNEFLNKKQEDVVNKNVFRLKSEYKKDEKTLHCFYEGKDNIFYRGFMENTFSGFSYYFSIGNGEKSFYDTYEKSCKTSNNFALNKNRILFFTDKDVDDYIGISAKYSDENIFETKYYSIENYVVSKNVFNRILTETFELENITDIDNFLKQFETNQKRFYEYSQFISAWIIHNRKCNYNSPLKDVKLEDLFTFECKNCEINLLVSTQYSTNEQVNNYLKEKTKTDKKINLTDINIIKKALNIETEQKKYTRGKFELWFFKEFYNQFNKKLIPEYNINIKNKKLNKKTMKNDSDISSNEKAIERFVSKLTIPDDIKGFLLNNYYKLN